MALEHLNNKSFATIMGSWPFVPSTDGGDPAYLTGALNPSGRILGIKREPSAGFVVAATRYINFDVDGTTFQATFAPSTYTLAQIIAAINLASQAAMTADVAFNNDSFLLLRSPTTGDGSYIRIYSEPGSEDIFDLLGLFSETVSYAGEPRQAEHIDPSRGAALPGQAMMQWGESFDANVFNRAAMNIALSADQSIATLERVRVAQRTWTSAVYGGGDDYIQVSDLVYTGRSGTPVEELIAFLDADDNEILVEKEKAITGNFGADTFLFYPDPETGEQLVEDNVAGTMFGASDAAGPVYLKFANLENGPAVLNGQLLKITRFLSSAVVAIDNVRSDTGAKIPITNADNNNASLAGDKIEVQTLKVEAAAIYTDAGLTQNAYLYTAIKQASTNVDRIEKGNRIYCSGADFSSVVEGDRVAWSGYLPTDPFTNNGAYLVARKIDSKTLELMAVDGGPVILNPAGTTPYGQVIVVTDGTFWQDPYIKFKEYDGVPLRPPTGSTVKTVYLKATNVKEAFTQDPAVFAKSVKYAEEVDFQTQKALIGLTGPSADSMSDVLGFLYEDRRNSIEGLLQNFRLEHYSHLDGEVGRHRDIRPDTIDMYPGVAGATGIFRNADLSEDGGTSVKLGLQDSTGSWRFTVNAKGHVSIGNQGAAANTELYIARNDQNVNLAMEAFGGYNVDLYGYAEAGNAGMEMYGDGVGNNAYVNLGTQSTYWKMWTQEGDVRDALRFDEGLLDVLVLDGLNGRVGVGTDVPTAVLQVYTRGQGEAFRLDGSSTQTDMTAIWRTHAATMGVVRATYIGAGDYAFSVEGFTNTELQLKTLAGKGIYIEPDADSGKAWSFDANGDLVPLGNPGAGEFQDVGSTSRWVQQFIGRRFYGEANGPAATFQGIGFSAAGVFNANPAFEGTGGNSTIAGKDAAPGGEFTGGTSNASGGEPGHGVLSTGGAWVADATGTGGIGVTGFGGDATTGSTGTKSGGPGAFFKGGLGDTGNSGVGVIAYPGSDGGGWAMAAQGYGGVIHPGSAGGGLLATSGVASSAAVDAYGFTGGIAVRARGDGAAGYGVFAEALNGAGRAIGAFGNSTGGYAIDVSAPGSSTGVQVLSTGTASAVVVGKSGGGGLAADFNSSVAGQYVVDIEHTEAANGNSSALHAKSKEGYAAVLEAVDDGPANRTPLRLVPLGAYPSSPQSGDVFYASFLQALVFRGTSSWVKTAEQGVNGSFVVGANTYTITNGHISNIA